MSCLRIVVLGCIVYVAFITDAECRPYRSSRRTRRRIDEFGQMITITTGRSPLAFTGYGNWCGIGGEGDPVDSIDKCCRAHDMCYNTVDANECKSEYVAKTYTKNYNWSAQDNVITCAKSNDECGSVLCDCDRLAANCIGDNTQEYNESFKHEDKLLAAISKIVSL